MNRSTAALLIGLSAAGLVGAAWSAGFLGSPRPELPRIGQPFELTAHSGQRVASASFGDKAVFVAFGYAGCPDICPTLLQTISDVMDRIPPAVAAQVQPVFITVDPERDTPDVLSAYLANFHPAILGLTGTAEEIAAVTKAYYVYNGKIAAPELPTGYMIQHASSLFLVSPDGGLLATFGYGRANADEIASALAGTVRPARGSP